MSISTQKFKINGLPADSDYKNLPFGRKIEYKNAIEQFKNTAKKDWISQKNGKSATKEIKKFLKSVGATQYYFSYYDREEDVNCWDDSFEIYYV